MTKKRWGDLSSRSRGLIITGALLEGALKLAALVDLARRPANQVRGSKMLWALAITVINSLGAVPIAYFVRGRTQRGSGLPSAVTLATRCVRRGRFRWHG